MTQQLRHPQFGQPNFKAPKAEKQPRKRMPRTSKKRRAYYASDEGKRAVEWMGRVKRLPCIICAKPGPSDAHHVCHGRYSTNKASDFDTIPLCRECHRALHAGKQTWAEKHGFDYTLLPHVAVQLGEVDF